MRKNLEELIYSLSKAGMRKEAAQIKNIANKYAYLKDAEPIDHEAKDISDTIDSACKDQLINYLADFLKIRKRKAGSEVFVEKYERPADETFFITHRCGIRFKDNKKYEQVKKLMLYNQDHYAAKAIIQLLNKCCGKGASFHPSNAYYDSTRNSIYFSRDTGTRKPKNLK